MIFDVITPSYDGLAFGFIFWSGIPGIESRTSIYVGLFCGLPFLRFP